MRESACMTRQILGVAAMSPAKHGAVAIENLEDGWYDASAQLITSSMRSSQRNCQICGRVFQTVADMLSG